jgi:hypothetical protein
MKPLAVRSPPTEVKASGEFHAAIARGLGSKNNGNVAPKPPLDILQNEAVAVVLPDGEKIVFLAKILRTVFPKQFLKICCKLTIFLATGDM